MPQAEETAHVATVRRQWALKKLASRKTQFRAHNGKLIPYTISPPEELGAVVASAIFAEKEAQEKIVAEALADPQIGQTIAGHGVYLGTWEPKDREGQSLGKIFNVFAAPQDLTDSSGTISTFEFNAAVARVAELRNWHGHDGAHFENDIAFYKALKNNGYNGEWLIPTLDILGGVDMDENEVHADSLYKNKDKGDLKNTFTEASNPHDSDVYWSCTQDRNYTPRIWTMRFSDGYVNWHVKGLTTASVRPVRLELIQSIRR